MGLRWLLRAYILSLVCSRLLVEGAWGGAEAQRTHWGQETSEHRLGFSVVHPGGDARSACLQAEVDYSLLSSGREPGGLTKARGRLGGSGVGGGGGRWGRLLLRDGVSTGPWREGPVFSTCV